MLKECARALELGKIGTGAAWLRRLLPLEDCRNVVIKWHLFSSALIDEILNRVCTK